MDVSEMFKGRDWLEFVDEMMRRLEEENRFWLAFDAAVKRVEAEDRKTVLEWEGVWLWR